jgi:hypothetical protein
LTTFLALYRGESVGASKLITLTAEPAVVADFATRMLAEPEEESGHDPVLNELETGRRRALALVKDEVEG